jgi:hypothetical protein
MGRKEKRVRLEPNRYKDYDRTMKGPRFERSSNKVVFIFCRVSHHLGHDSPVSHPERHETLHFIPIASFICPFDTLPPRPCPRPHANFLVFDQCLTALEFVCCIHLHCICFHFYFIFVFRTPYNALHFLHPNFLNHLGSPPLHPLLLVLPCLIDNQHPPASPGQPKAVAHVQMHLHVVKYPVFLLCRPPV